MADELPGIEWRWTAYAGVDPFVAYHVHRRRRRSLLDAREALTMQLTTGRTQMPTADVLSGIRGAFVQRVTINTVEPLGGAGLPTFLDYQQDSSHLIRGRYDEANNRWQLVRTTGAGTSTLNLAHVPTAGQKITRAVAWDASTLYISINGAPWTTAASVAGAEIIIDAIDIGTRQGFDDADETTHWALAFADVPSESVLTALAALPDALYVRQLRDLAPAYPSAMWNGDELIGHKVVLDEWTQIAAITDVARPLYRDYAVASGQAYEYAITVATSVFGEPISSEKQDPPFVDSCTFAGVIVQDASNPLRWYVTLPGTELQWEPQQDRRYVQASGRAQQTAQFGELQSRRFSFVPTPGTVGEWGDAVDLEALFSRQPEAGAVLLVRPGYAPERYFCQLDALPRQDTPEAWRTGPEFQQVHFDEAVG